MKLQSYFAEYCDEQLDWKRIWTFKEYYNSFLIQQIIESLCYTRCFYLLIKKRLGIHRIVISESFVTSPRRKDFVLCKWPKSLVWVCSNIMEMKRKTNGDTVTDSVIPRSPHVTSINVFIRLAAVQRSTRVPRSWNWMHRTRDRQTLQSESNESSPVVGFSFNYRGLKVADDTFDQPISLRGGSDDPYFFFFFSFFFHRSSTHRSNL